MAYDPNVIATIISVGRQRGLGPREITAALSTGIVESGLRNVDYGDRDSLGVFQQRPSQGWGSPQQLMDVVYATNKFYDAIKQFDAPGISGAELAARIQRPAAKYRGRYADKWGEAQRLFSGFSGDAPSFPVPAVGGGFTPGYTVPTYPTKPLPIPAEALAGFAQRRAASRRAVRESQIAKRLGGQQITGDFNRFLKELDRQAARATDDVMSEASARNLAFQPGFVAPALKDVREQTSASRAAATSEKAERLAALQAEVDRARRTRRDVHGDITRERARLRSQLDKLVGI